MLGFGMERSFRRIEEGLAWKDGGVSQAPGRGGRTPEGVFVEVPVFLDKDQLEAYITSLAIEANHVLGDTKPAWLQLRGAGVQSLLPGDIRDVADAVYPGVTGLGLELNPRLLGPGDIAGYRSVGAERFSFRMESPYDKVDDTVRRARALGAFTSVEVRYSDELNWLSFMHAVGRALESAPNQVSIADERVRNTTGSERLEAAAEKIQNAGYRRLSLWAWAKTDSSFDQLGDLLAGHCVGMGPCAYTCRPGLYRNPGTDRWIITRSVRNFEVSCADGSMDQWLDLVSRIYALDLKRGTMDFKMHRQVGALLRTGFLDKQGKPAAGKPMEFCHRAVRLAMRAMTEAVPAPASTVNAAKGRKGLELWRTGSGGS